MHTEAVHKGHLGKGLQKLYGDISGVQVLISQALQIRQLAAIHPLHGDDPLPRQLRSMAIQHVILSAPLSSASAPGTANN